MKTTLREILTYDPCGREQGSKSGYDKLKTYLDNKSSSVEWPLDKEFPMELIIDSNGIDDCLWLLGGKEEKFLWLTN